MRLISAFIITLISAVIVFTSFELKSWRNNIRTEDVQSFVRYSDTQLNLTSWEEYLEQEIELIPISEKIIKINISNIAPKKLSESIKRFEGIKYAQLYNLKIILNNKMKSFNISATITLP
jgi:hypothetical protein|tara:strand:- start:1346 stop:1705 length:360 start_codon:yes stop_codon:yes gene_type:complete